MIGGINIDNKNLSFFETVNKLCGEKKTIGSFFKATITVLFSSKSNISSMINKLNTNKVNVNIKPLNGRTSFIINPSNFGKTADSDFPTIRSIEDVNLFQNELLAKYMSETETTIKDMSKNPQNIDTKALSETIQSLTVFTKNILNVAEPYIGNSNKKKDINNSHIEKLNSYCANTTRIMKLIPESAKKDKNLFANFEKLENTINQLRKTYLDLAVQNS
jgi:hypothetical protein